MRKIWGERITSYLVEYNDMDEQGTERDATAVSADVVPTETVPDVVPDTSVPDAVTDTAVPRAPDVSSDTPAQVEPTPIVQDIVLELVPTAPAGVPESETVPALLPTPEPASEFPTIQIDQTPSNSTPEPTQTSTSLFSNSRELANKEPEVKIVERVVEKVVEKIVEKEVIKEVPVEKIVEKIVYRDPVPTVCPPPTQEERDTIKRDFLIELSHEGTAKKHDLMIEKLATILTLFDTSDHIMHKDVMDALDCSGTTATRLLTELRHEGKILLHGTGGNGATYTKI